MIGFLPRPRRFIDEPGPNEAEALAEIHAEAFQRPWSADDLAVLISDRTVFALAARRESLFGWRRLSGFVICRMAADEAEVLTIAVRNASRGYGFGRLLMEEALRRLYRDRIASCFLEVDPGNAAAVGLYQSLGFEAVGERKGYYRRAQAPAAAALVMRLRLRPAQGSDAQ